MNAMSDEDVLSAFSVRVRTIGKAEWAREHVRSNPKNPAVAWRRQRRDAGDPNKKAP
jgi:hypothetical protein